MATSALAIKYRPKDFDDVVEQSIPSQMLAALCESKKLATRNFLLIGNAGCGKAQPLYSKVLTPSGFVEMRDVTVGQEVITGTGARGRVTGVYPQGVRPIYEIELQDRTTIRVSDEHLNVFYRYNTNTKRREDYCMTTSQLISFMDTCPYKLRMDVPAVDWDPTDLPIDPYLLGALIGDGSLSNNFGFSNNEPDVVAAVDDILRRDWHMMLKKVPGDNVDYSIVDEVHADHKYIFTYKDQQNLTTTAIQSILVADGYPMFDGQTLIRTAQGVATRTLAQYPELAECLSVTVDPDYREWSRSDTLLQLLTQLGLRVRSVDKHIPKQYLLASRHQRLRLLQGLFDTDGYIDKHGAVTFTTCSDTLSEDFAFLVRSLGIRDTVSNYPAKYVTQDGQLKYTGSTAHDHNLKVPNDLVFCTSVKHLHRRCARQHPPLRNIVSIRYVGDEECQCIMIDHPDHTYISDGFIPTHNTTLARIVANKLNDGLGEPIELDAASNSGVDNMRELIQQARMFPIGCKYKVYIIDECHALSPSAWAALLKPLEEGVGSAVWMLCTTNPEKIPATILSRVQTFKLSKISTQGIVNRLKFILDSEIAEGRQITYTEDAIQFIAKIANGGMRDAITMLDQVLSYSPNVTSETAVESLNLPNYDDFFELLNAYAKRDNEAIVSIIHRVYNSGVNFNKWFENFHAFIMNIVKFIFTKDINYTVIPIHYESKIAKYSTQHATICLSLANKLLELIRDLKSAQYMQEIALTYLCTVPRKENI